MFSSNFFFSVPCTTVYFGKEKKHNVEIEVEVFSCGKIQIEDELLSQEQKKEIALYIKDHFGEYIRQEMKQLKEEESCY